MKQKHWNKWQDLVNKCGIQSVENYREIIKSSSSNKINDKYNTLSSNKKNNWVPSFGFTHDMVYIF